MKTGKTTTASKFDKALLLAFETGYLAIPGVMAQPINKWSEFKQVLRQLKDDNAKNTFSNIVMDTVDIAYDLCEKYICAQAGVSSINEIPYGQGWTKAAKEFDEAIRSIPQMGYGLVMISHSQDKVFKDEDGNEYNQIVPTLPNKARLIVDRAADIIGYAHPVQDEDGSTHTRLYMRGTPRFVSGSRFKYSPDYIEHFNYENLVNAIADAIDKQAAEDDGKFVTSERTTAYNVQESKSYDELMNDIKSLVKKIQTNTGAEFKTKWQPKITAITEKYLGVGKKVNDCTPMQTEQLELIYDDISAEVANGL